MLLRFAGLAHERVAITAALNVQAHGMTKNLRFFIFKGVANGSVHYGTACPESYRYLAGIVQVSRLPALEEPEAYVHVNFTSERSLPIRLYRSL